MKAMKRKRKQKPSPGWTSARLRQVLDYYDKQSDDEAAAEIEKGFNAETETVVIVPKNLLPAIKQLINRSRKARAG